LIVDDNATNRRILEEMFAQWQMRSNAVDGGRAALAALEQAESNNRPFSLMVLDVHMPEMDGFTLVEKIRQRVALIDTRIILLTSTGQQGDASRCRELGISAYLPKPIKQSELLQAVLTVLGESPPASLSATSITAIPSVRLGDSPFLLVEDNLINQKLAVRLWKIRPERSGQLCNKL